MVGALAAPLVVGAVGLSLAQGTSFQPTPVAPVAIQALAASGATAIKGEVAEVFGNKFVVQDGTGRALVETGRAGEGGGLVARGEAVTVQGRFERGLDDGNLFIEAQASIDTPDGLRLHHAEIREPRFARAFSLSADFDISKIDANLSDGVLKLSIPRREEARPRRIEVSVD